MTEKLHGSYEKAIAELKDVADGGARKRAEEKNAINHLLSLNGTKPRAEPETTNPLVNMVLRQVRR
ncbi:hypothetical protein GBA63_14425 [Rubrobacter tropicus]|uniref:Uncharacterized protein n=1 Tax=Rubrobacter tropicus TaxID=2653851 RepID=A0A6G8QB88_9ACTN|nr:hypothetical protein [Rubrobacter tropicus]QIN83692.1 hypothetical protein GBA63_14425 [Rubrobacter tropicus]